MRRSRRHLSRIVLAALLSTAATASRSAEVHSVGITVGSLGNPYYAVTDKGIADAAGKLTPGAHITAVSADYDLGKQFTQVENFMAAGASIIMLNAVDPVAIAPAIKRAQAQGVVVASFDVAARGSDVTVMTDNVAAGAQACQYLADHLPGGAGDVIILNGPQISAVIDRVNGCEKVLAAHPGIHILSDNQDAQGSREGGLAKGQGLLIRFPHVNAIFAINDPTAIGLNLAAHQLNRHGFFITSVDGSPDVVTEIKNPNSLIKASSAQDPYGMASHAYALAVDVLHGRKPASPVVLIKPTLVTAANVGAYTAWNTQPHEVTVAGP